MSISYTVQQLSVFLENRAGRLDDVLKVLSEGGVNIVALSLADTADYGMLRMIVSDPHKGRVVLKEAGITAMLTDVIAFRVAHATGSLSKAMHQLVEGEINIEYMYVLSTSEYASMIVKIADYEKAEQILTDKGYTLLTEEEAYRANETAK